MKAAEYICLAVAFVALAAFVLSTHIVDKIQTRKIENLEARVQMLEGKDE
jgi:hypothetical protein